MSVLVSFLEPLMDPASRTWWGSLLAALLLTTLFAWKVRPGWTWSSVRSVILHPSTGLDLQLFVSQQLLRLLLGAPSVATGWWLATHGVRWLDAHLGRPMSPDLSPLVVTVTYTMVLFLAWDLSRFLVHLTLH
ncbi:MAG: hypothetical protein QGG40_10475, partial [Myxococcota bacterium]|nr:hypothetical protein [Myxococcota bacterium]